MERGKDEKKTEVEDGVSDRGEHPKIPRLSDELDQTLAQGDKTAAVVVKREEGKGRERTRMRRRGMWPHCCMWDAP